MTGMRKVEMADIEQISIYKFKTSIKSYEECVKVNKKGNPFIPILKYETIAYDNLNGKFWYSEGDSKEKDSKNIPWIAFMNEVLQNPIEILYANRFPRGLFLYKLQINNNDEFFAITFGLGGDANINKSKILHDFGIKVAMNICNPDAIKSIQTAQQEAISIQSEKQILSGAGLSVFNIDYNDEFFKKIVGKTKEKYNYISCVTGGEKIQLKFDRNNPLTWENIVKMTIELNNLYYDESYKKTDFKSFDNWNFEKDTDVINSLNEKLIDLINKKSFDKISLCVPDIIDIDRFCFKYNKDNNLEYDELNILEFISSLSRHNVSINMLQNKYVFVKDKISEQVYSKWKIYQCIVAEISNNDDCYILYNGQWRKISNDFRNSVVNYFIQNNVKFDKEYLVDVIKENINIFDSKSKQNREEIFNKVCVTNNDKLFLFDKSKIIISGEKKYETCDILSSNKQLIHVKKYKTGASSLSHLFIQAKFYSDAIIIDNDTKNTMCNFMDSSCNEINSPNYGKNSASFKAVIPLDKRLNERDFTVVLCILTENNIELTDLPFMTQYEISKMHDYLTRNRGFNVKYINRKVIMH